MIMIKVMVILYFFAFAFVFVFVQIIPRPVSPRELLGGLAQAEERPHVQVRRLQRHGHCQVVMMIIILMIFK